ncbi:MAG: hypothetical protein UU40_C0005G0029 [Candidatus Uhrbacteria bacterium GW2011_GWD2_41_121]|uniref:UPF0235 protein UU50_C0005G0029 n=1 Tax=Candidatus Uhrbacteria bacterium GW2011_GWC1_41_20 TaxID=1618983 RepID=A0A0G0YGN4_9BACT|nr:MAG: hypothetical protein UT52_C0007G0029 [Candidatus Uhrbacteria bacterium GW2011_GWE1_39_46]KKR64165.1 MAG: hypothetical protein UU04_C0005G0029 [Candidatus Uhrbacteria bacterium GW2011_GWC2_40_450]KKR89082.1 MAG: hypothetical protein UU36_C0037G0013 [Candidatus Uhrbacteria bacterium GW2011_GWE2_41_1153]KKR90300.1 MAG: hypothetical protein UU40_C0005G0029 [Candidatus Uhrbacteria bacterium GW2011_GWD2_41_121]KKR95979.1 MAG: hypothetical protein UU46_C0010G0014 [Candidatus Uhrbacteria bacter
MILTVHVKPNAKKTGFRSWMDSSTVVIDLCAPPVDGKANVELINFLAKQLKLAKSLVILKRGHSSRVKHIQLPDKTDTSKL